ncbi:hypothetical protein CUJ87_12325 [Paraburkholderia caledonica]|nr:hypothetical protein CUJ87_12325 [Paraburkholderia caledonica]
MQCDASRKPHAIGGETVGKSALQETRCRPAPLVYTPASGKKQVTDLRELRNASHRLRHWNPRSKPTALHAPLLAGPSHRGAA